MKASITLTVLATVAWFCAAAQAANLIKDGGFEYPQVQAGSYSTLAPGEKLGEWSVIASAAVSPCPQLLVNTGYRQDGIAFTARSGNQWLDLGDIRGASCYNAASEGIQQTVATTPGAAYTLTFWVGSIYDPKIKFTEMPRIYAFANGNLLTSTVVFGLPGSSQQWKQYTASFTAASDRTTISFLAPVLDPQDVGLDDVVLVAVP
jgi:hypothetical protein